MADENPGQRQLEIQSDPQTAVGVYSNLMVISHRREEFVLDFLFVQPERGTKGTSVANLRSRIVTTPEHMKRILKAVEENLRRYEAKYGTIQEATDLPQVIH